MSLAYDCKAGACHPAKAPGPKYCALEGSAQSVGAHGCHSLAWHVPVHRMAEICPPRLNLVPDWEEMSACPSPHPRHCHLICFLQSWHLSSLTCFSLSCGHQETALGEEHAAGKPSSVS